MNYDFVEIRTSKFGKSIKEVKGNMRFLEFKSPSIKEAKGKASNKATRYNTEVGLLVGMCGVNPETFDPLHPDDPTTGIPPNMLKDNGKRVYKDIVNFLGKNFDQAMFIEWANKAPGYMQKVSAKLGKTPTVFDWAGGTNQNEEGVADIEFVGMENQGISVKAASGITLRNLTPKALGLTVERGNDVFYQYAGAEYKAMKESIFAKVLEEAKAKPGVNLGFHRESPDKYYIVYNPPKTVTPAAPAPQQPVPDELSAVKKNAGLPPTTSAPAVTPTVDNTQVNEDEQTSTQEGTWTCVGKTSFTGTRQQIMASVVPNKKWHRVFGDWFQANYQANKELAKPLYAAISNMFKNTMVQHLTQDRNLDTVLAMGKNSYFYVNDVDIFYVPSIDNVADLQLKKVDYGAISSTGTLEEADGTSQKFQAQVGRPSSTDNAKILIYIRYANGMFACNPTVRVQDLKDPVYLGWEHL
jgi:hypothetical protein